MLSDGPALGLREADPQAHYNMTITLVLVLVAVLIGGIESLGLITDKLGLSGGFSDGVGRL
ncbi:hypothetical protein [Mesorhizobium sp. M4A.F.Ca.ET.050.02.1.1]|uniref:HoxN/HupN/NixA family nickel/cobalt transporter n=1 Tax=Mesorhizobium sp. M4A.F.Ca.ET.050.02.1.1 TaxID=2496754 RepID=UPI001FDF21C0|nr:hypothetical protein [Mesorhizobium sp. M4A.F.Ca.ET.050.02.1.1]